MLKYAMLRFLCFRCSFSDRFQESDCNVQKTQNKAPKEPASSLGLYCEYNEASIPSLNDEDTKTFPGEESMDSFFCNSDALYTNEPQFELEPKIAFDANSEPTSSFACKDLNSLEKELKHSNFYSSDKANSLKIGFSCNSAQMDLLKPSKLSINMAESGESIKTANNQKFPTILYYLQPDEQHFQGESEPTSKYLSYSHPNTQETLVEEYNLKHRKTLNSFNSKTEQQSRKRILDKSHDCEMQCKDLPMLQSTNLTNHALEPKIKRVKLDGHVKPPISFKNRLRTNFTKQNVSFNKSGFLKKFDHFLELIEELLNFFLQGAVNHEKINPHRLLYSSELVEIESFSTVIFGEYTSKASDRLRILSSTADMITNFVQSIDLDEKMPPMFFLKGCFGLDSINDQTEETMAREIKNYILDYLNSDDSKYLKSVCTGLHSLVKCFELLQIRDIQEAVRGFIVFLILAKRNELITPILKKKLKFAKKSTEKVNLIFDEVLYSSAFFFSFIKSWPPSDPSHILSNMKTNIILNCIKRDTEHKKRSKTEEIIYIYRHFIFELRIFNLSVDFQDIFNFTTENEIKAKKWIKINAHLIDNAKTYIYEMHETIVNKFKTICRLKTGRKKKMNTLMHYLRSTELLPIWQLKLMLDFTRTLSVYSDCIKSSALTPFFYSFARIKKPPKQKRISCDI